MPISASIKTLFSKARILNTGSPEVTLYDSESFGIFSIICADLRSDAKTIGLDSPRNVLPSSNYYEIPLSWFDSHRDSPSLLRLLNALQSAVNVNPDFGMYFCNVCSL